MCLVHFPSQCYHLSNRWASRFLWNVLCSRGLKKQKEKKKEEFYTRNLDETSSLFFSLWPWFIVFLSYTQSEDDFSLSGIALTALYFHTDSRLLISGDQSGMVKCHSKSAQHMHKQIYPLVDAFVYAQNVYGFLTIFSICRFAFLNLNLSHMLRTVLCLSKVWLMFWFYFFG